MWRWGGLMNSKRGMMVPFEVACRLSRRGVHLQKPPMLKPTAFLLLCVMLVVGCAGVSEEPETAEPAQPVASAGAEPA